MGATMENPLENLMDNERVTRAIQGERREM